MDPQKREKLLTQAANMQIGIDDKTGIALDTYKSLYKKTFKDLNDLEKAIKDYINWYNSDRVCKKLKGLSPINFRKQALNSVSMT